MNLPIVAGTALIADIMYPRKVVPSIFIPNCNLRCPYCINRELVLGHARENLDIDELCKKYLMMGEKWLMVTGAEALMNVDIMNLLARIRFYGIKVALATNGTFFKRLKEAVSEDLANHVVMDVKTSLDIKRYKEVSGISLGKSAFNSVLKCIDFLKETDKCTTEFRTTMCGKYLTKDDVHNIASYLGKDALYIMQYYTIHQTLDPELANEKYIIPYPTLQEWAVEIAPLVRKALVREV